MHAKVTNMTKNLLALHMKFETKEGKFVGLICRKQYTSITFAWSCATFCFESENVQDHHYTKLSRIIRVGFTFRFIPR